MPLYEYKCETCDNAFEKLVFHEGEAVRCPVCEGSARKLFSSFSYAAVDDECAKLPRGEQREVCTECRQGGGSCPFTA